MCDWSDEQGARDAGAAALGLVEGRPQGSFEGSCQGSVVVDVEAVGMPSLRCCCVRLKARTGCLFCSFAGGVISLTRTSELGPGRTLHGGAVDVPTVHDIAPGPPLPG